MTDDGDCGAAAVAPAIAITGPAGGPRRDAARRRQSAPVVLIIPGSGPTDRDGNNPLGVTAAPIGCLPRRSPQRAFRPSASTSAACSEARPPIADPNKVTIGRLCRRRPCLGEGAAQRTARKCVWVLGHSEGGLVALAAGQQPDGICGVILVVGGRPKLGDIIREQLRANPANAPLLPQAMAALD